MRGEITLEWMRYLKDKCVLKMDGYDDLYSTDYMTLLEVAKKRILGKIVMPKLAQDEAHWPAFLYSHKCRCEIMDKGKHKGNFVVRSLKDRSKYWHLGPTDLIIVDEPVYEQMNLFERSE